jgi:hypothetical protein
MQNIFIAIGGSGTKVAETLVRLLAIGYPTRIDEQGIVTSAGHSLQIWRLDPDRSSGAAVSLTNCIRQYKELQEHLGYIKENLTGSQWAMELDTEVRHLDPLQLSNNGPKNEANTLRQILGTGGKGKESTKPLLDIFYEEKELEVNITKGFYQKPFIGAAVMAIYAKSLEDENSPGGSKCKLTALSNRPVRFFLCGSLHGGTGACGVPIMGKFLSDARLANPDRPWKIGACLLAPYSIPPEPPFTFLEDEEVTPERVDQYLRQYGNDPAFSELSKEEKQEVIKQILLGFYANPKEMVARARQSLLYYKDHVSTHFDQLYLIGKPEPDKLKKWSNGGRKQNNPLNCTEVVAALAALNFFSGAAVGNPNAYVIAGSTSDLNPQRARLQHLPKYTITKEHERVEVDPERVFLATAIAHHFIRKQIPWDTEAKRWSGIEGLRKSFYKDESKKESDWKHYEEATDLIAKFMLSVIDPNQTEGWDADDANEVAYLLSDEFSRVTNITDKISKRYKWPSQSKEAKGSLALGKSSIKISATELGEWCPSEEHFTRGDYLRFLWWKLFTKRQQ